MAFSRIYQADSSFDPDFSGDEDDVGLQRPIYTYEKSTIDYTSQSARDEFLHKQFAMTEKRHDEDYDDDFEAAGSGVPARRFYEHTSYSKGQMGSLNDSDEEDAKEEEDPKEDQEAQDIKKKKKKKKNNKKKKKT